MDWDPSPRSGAIPLKIFELRHPQKPISNVRQFLEGALTTLKTPKVEIPTNLTRPSTQMSHRSDNAFPIEKELSVERVIETLTAVKSPANLLNDINAQEANAQEDAADTQTSVQEPDDSKRKSKLKGVIRTTIKLPKLENTKIEEETESDLKNQSLEVIVPRTVAELSTVISSEELHENQSDAPASPEKSSHKTSPPKSRRRSSLSHVVRKRRPSVISRRRTISENNQPVQLDSSALGPNDSVSQNALDQSPPEDPKMFYTRRRRMSSIVGNLETESASASEIGVRESASADYTEGNGSTRDRSNHSSAFTLADAYASADSLLSRTTTASHDNRDADPPAQPETTYMTEDVTGVLVSRTLPQALAVSGFLKAGHRTLFDVTHDKIHRINIFTELERFKYSTLTDQGIPHDPFSETPITDPEILALESDPQTEIEKLSVLIKQSNAPIPAYLRRRGYLFSRISRFDDAIRDLDRAILYGIFYLNIFNY